MLKLFPPCAPAFPVKLVAAQFCNGPFILCSHWSGAAAPGPLHPWAPHFRRSDAPTRQSHRTLQRHDRSCCCCCVLDRSSSDNDLTGELWDRFDFFFPPPLTRAQLHECGRGATVWSPAGTLGTNPVSSQRDWHSRGRCRFTYRNLQISSASYNYGMFGQL